MLINTLTENEVFNQNSTEELWAEGIRHVLTDNPEEAQASFLMPFLSLESDMEEGDLQNTLLRYLQNTLVQLHGTDSAIDLHKVASCAQEIFPDNLNMLLQMIESAVALEIFDFSILQEKSLLEVLEATPAEEIDQELLQSVIRKCLNLLEQDIFELMPREYFPELIAAFLEKATNQFEAIDTCGQAAFFFVKQKKLSWLGIKIMEVCLALDNPDLRFDLLGYLAIYLYFAGDHQRSIEVASELLQENRQGNPLQIAIASYTLMHCYLGAGDWLKGQNFANEYWLSLENLSEYSTQAIFDPVRVINSSYFLNYLYDQPRMQHQIRNKLGKITTNLVQKKFEKVVSASKPRGLQPLNKTLRIGYVASTLSQHSVGWLSRGLFRQHNHEEFQIYIYNIIVSDQDEFNVKFFRPHADWSHYFSANAATVANQIQKDEIDILVDLDSLTFSTTYEVMSLRPAPIQVTWLGWDSSGCPEIDYFIADPHVLPADAEEYYHPKIWRLPETYIAVDGFEVGLPTVRRADYHLPEDAVVYLCGQKSYKHHPDILRLQMQIIKEVSNSYLLVKLRGDRGAMTDTYETLAREVGIDLDRLRFLNSDVNELSHRANLHLADVVLDTFPYNGATTTLETIWAGIPIVTKVGEAFVARNSYAFLTHAGIAEGVAHTDEEYLAWGIKLGCDAQLRQQVSGKMLQSRKTSALWDTKQFTREMENTYRKMWEIHQGQDISSL
jgi:predicted O-linked N-acetylglucosamine transferase (SPINDLY family)